MKNHLSFPLSFVRALGTVRYFISGKGQHPSLKHTGETFLHTAGERLSTSVWPLLGPHVDSVLGTAHIRWVSEA